MPILQRIVQTGRKILPRGWSPVLRCISYVYPTARTYPAYLTNGDTLFVDLSENMCHRYFYDGELRNEEYSVAFFKEVIRPGDIFIDIGANIGYFTKIGASLVGSHGAVFAFEPNPKALRLLRENTRTANNVKLFDTALSDRRGISNFSVNKDGDTSSLGSNPNAQRTIQVPLDTLDNSLKLESRVDVIKIDVEGYELDVLKGAATIIAQHKPLLYFEFIPDYTRERLINIDDFRTVLDPHGYTLHWMNPKFPNSSLTTKIPSWYVIGVPLGSRWSDLV